MSAVERFGVVIPAYRGAATISRSLDSLRRQDFVGHLHVVVAVNDDRQDTFAAAAAFVGRLRAGDLLEVIRTPAGRGAAIAAAEERLSAGPRLYLDQDAKISPAAVRVLSAALVAETHFATVDVSVPVTSHAVVRAYYRAWRSLPYVQRSPATAGLYAVSAEGRRRWDSLPSMHSDDKFVRSRFLHSERAMVREASYECVGAADLSTLVAARRRYDRGNRELARTSSGEQDVSRRSGLLRMLATNPLRCTDFAVLVLVHLWARAAELVDGSAP